MLPLSPQGPVDESDPVSLVCYNPPIPLTSNLTPLNLITLTSDPKPLTPDL